MSSNSGKTVLALVTGVAIGAGIGILFAPDKGSRTRSKIKHGYDEAKHNLQHKIEDLSDQIKGKILKKKFDLEDDYEELKANMDHKRDEFITFLEKKLHDLKSSHSKSKV